MLNLTGQMKLPAFTQNKPDRITTFVILIITHKYIIIIIITTQLESTGLLILL